MTFHVYNDKFVYSDDSQNIVEQLAIFQSHFRTVDQFCTVVRKLVLDIEAVLSAQINAIIEHKKFLELEALWMGTSSVVWSKDETSRVKIKLFDLNWQDLQRDLNYITQIRHSTLFRRLGMQEVDTLGGEPFGLLMIDHELSVGLDTEFDEPYTAQLLCNLGEICMCPIILGAGDGFFGESDTAWYTDIQRINNVLNTQDYNSWKVLRNAPNAQFLGLVMPRILLRSRYENRYIGFPFHQRPSDSEGLWGSASFAFIRTVIAEFQRCGWFGFLKFISTEAGMGAVLAESQYPVPKATHRGARARVRLTGSLARTYAEMGFIPLAESTKSNRLYFVGNRSVAKCAKSHLKEITTQLQSQMIVCRLVHYIKIQIRAMIGQVQTTAECENTLNRWLENYTSTSSASLDQQAKYPLRGAKVKIREDRSGLARFQCAVTIIPQYQIDHSIGEVTLKTEFDADNFRKSA